MRLLDAVNLGLTSLGEGTVTNVDTNPNPTIGLIEQSIQNTKRGMLTRGWWFNEVNKEFCPDSNGRIAIPPTTLEIFTDDDSVYLNRSGYLFDAITYSFVFSNPVKIRLTIDVDFEELPENFAQMVAYLSAAGVYANDLGVDNNHAQLVQQANYHLTQVNTLHLRNRKFSTHKSKPYRRYLSSLRT